jgi:hypothetical protein
MPIEKLSLSTQEFSYIRFNIADEVILFTLDFCIS